MISYNTVPLEYYKCIWMSSGVVEYKLCDKNFECEKCPFDSVIRNQSNLERNGYIKENSCSMLDKLIDNLLNLNYEKKLIYLKNRFVIKHLFAGTYYLGLDPLLDLFINDESKLEDCGHEGNVLQNQAMLKLKGEWGYVTLASPINFYLIEKLKDSKWFAIINVVQPEITTARVSKKNWQFNKLNTIKTLNEYRTSFPKIGLSMYDGGAEVKLLNHLIGNGEYLRLLSKLIY